MRHTSHYTVIGNHLAQHRELSLVAIGLAVHIQSLRPGARVGVKCLAGRFPESEPRIAAAMRELEAAGYLERSRERLPNGRMMPRTISYNRPGADAQPLPVPVPAPRRAPVPEQPAPVAAPPAPPVRPGPPPPPLPEPAIPDPDRHRAAADLLSGLRRHEPRLLLSEPDVHRLAPAVAAWLERDAAPDAVRRTLTAGLPDVLRNPAALLAHRLTAMLPPPLPAAPKAPDPLQTCEVCDRAFRAPGPGRCRGCLA
ncbi:helix-turn-helix domain-containing protein [Streptomyces ficellus]|uniref:Helix-turn-helix domain-containing protein n=1 Tax=Streptomyces ficellus TaxID=1977088 RepID=A0A6I6FK27_9ACTN|nr:helix-turn-helix domain-containing protein [Streptomyces ficellus]